MYIFLHTFFGCAALLESALNLGFQGGLTCSNFTNYLVSLTWLVTQVALVSGGYQVKSLQVLWQSVLFSSEALHTMVFTADSVFTFFIAYEGVLIPLQLLISHWGSGVKRLRASILFFVYTYAGSVPMTVAALYLASLTEALVITRAGVFFATCGSASLVLGLWLSFALSFGVKTPLWPFFTWLLFAHAEAPVEGSMILAGVVLKLATFGVTAILVGMLWKGSHSLGGVGLTAGSSTLLMASVSLLQQVDIKAFIALSSVAHMGNSTLGLMSQSEEGVAGALYMGISHGLVSPGLFLIGGGLLYSAFNCRLLYAYRGILALMPLTGSLLFAYLMANIAVPMSPNWISELMILVGLAYDTPSVCFFSSLNVLLGAVYTLWFLSRILFGPWSAHLRGNIDLEFDTFFVLVFLAALTLGLGLAATGATSALQVSGWLYV